MRKGKSMAMVLGYYLSGAIAVAITFIGARFFFARYAAAAAYGIAVEPDPRWEAYLSVKAIRDIAAGLFTATLMLYRSPGLLGWFMLVATIIPIGDAVIVLKHGGTKKTALGIHGATAVTMLFVSGLLILG
jgi:hypothetical protein